MNNKTPVSEFAKLHPNCGISTGIHDRLTFGSGRLDDCGFWEKPDYEAARTYERLHPESAPCWPHTDEQIAKMNQPTRIREARHFAGLTLARRIIEETCPMINPYFNHGGINRLTNELIDHPYAKDIIGEMLNAAVTGFAEGGWGNSDTCDVAHLLHITVIIGTVIHHHPEITQNEISNWMEIIWMIYEGMENNKHDEDHAASSELYVLSKLWNHFNNNLDESSIACLNKNALERLVASSNQYAFPHGAYAQIKTYLNLPRPEPAYVDSEGDEIPF